MATFPIKIVIDPAGAVRGASKVKSELSVVEKEAKRTSDSIKRAFSTLAAGLGVREVIKLADSFTLLQNQLRTVTKDSAELASVSKEVRAVANATRSSVDVTALAYTRFSRSLKETGVSQKEVLAFTQSVNQVIQESGASSQEARNGLIQFSQGLAAGALRGDEFRSITEQLPVILDVVQEKLGVTRAEITKMAHAGQLSGKIIFDAFKEARGEIGERFAKLIPTVSGQLEVLRTNFVFFLGQLQPLFTGLGNAVRFLADNMTLIATVVSVALVPAMIRLVVATASWIALKLAESVLLTFASMVQLNNGVQIAVGGLKKFGQGIAAVVAASPGLKGLAAAFGAHGIAAAIVAAAVALIALFVALKDVRKEMAKSFEGAPKSFKRAAEVAPVLSAQLAITNSLMQHHQRSVDAATAATNKWRDALLSTARAIGALPTSRISGGIRAFIDGIPEVLTGMRQWDRSQRNLNDRMVSFVGMMRAVVPVAIDDYVDKLEKAREAHKKFLEEFKAFQETHDPVTKAMNDYDAALALVDRAVRKGLVNQAQANELMRAAAFAIGETLEKAKMLAGAYEGLAGVGEFADPSQFVPTANTVEAQFARDFPDLVRREREERKALSKEKQEQALKDIELAKNAEEMKSQAIEAERARIQLAQEFTRGLVDAAFDADKSFSDFFHDFFLNLAKAIAQALLLKAILSATGGSPDGATGGIGALFGFAHGGAFQVGGAGGTDSQVVAFRATPGEHVEVRTPSQQMDRGGGGGSQDVRVVVVDNKREAQLEVLRSRPGERVILETIRRNRDALGI